MSGAIPPAAANVAAVITDRDGRVLTAWQGPNILLDRGRSAFAAYLAGGTIKALRYFQLGTGTAIPAAQDTALQFRVTAKATGHSSAIGASGLTARFYVTLGATQMTGLITELMIGQGTASEDYLHAKVLVNGGTGITHASGTQAIFSWDFVLATGQQPF